MEASQLAMVMSASHAMGHYDKALLAAVAAGLKAKWMALSTPEALSILRTFSAAGHYDRELYDDLADSITYCNHMYSALFIDPRLVADGFAAYAKFNHERCDLLIQLTRGVCDEEIERLAPADRRNVVMSILRAFAHFNFWPEVTQSLFVLTKLRGSDYSPADMAEVAGYVAKVEGLYGPLTYYNGGYKNPAKHYHEHATHTLENYQMHVFRDSLTPKSYSPLSVRPMKSP